jgi:hypothetical protein
VSNENDAVRSTKEKSVSIPLLFDDHEASGILAAKIIPKFHPYISSAKFRFLCRNKASMKAKEKIPGYVKKASPMDKHLCGGECDFIMVVALDVWNDLNETSRVALIDHLLARCVGIEDEKTGEMKYSIRPPQVQEFPEIAQRHGRWNEALVELGTVLDRK